MHSDVAADHWANLLWACHAPHIATDPRLPWLPPERLAALAAFFALPDTRRRLQAPLEEAMAASSSPRLGVYFEDLWSFIFRHHPDYRLVARNLPLRAGGRTLGELDFVVHHRADKVTEHWEIAVKFYLQVAGRYWIGPGLRDRLDSKLEHMASHQLPVAQRPDSRRLLAERGIHIERQWALMPGRLFRPLGDDSGPPDQSPIPVNATSCRYWWATPAAFARQFETWPIGWGILPRRAWLADSGYRQARSHSCHTLARALTAEWSDAGSARPACVAGTDHSGEVSRGFVVPPNWHDLALAHL